MIKNGYEREHANMFTLSTCVEVTPIGCSGVSVTSPYINLLKIFLESLDKCDDNCEFEDIFSTFTKDFKEYAKRVMLNENLWQLERKRNGRDPIRVSVLIHDCIEKGASHDSGGAKYNFIEPDILGMQNTGESLNCIYRLVYLEKKLTLGEYKKALKENFEGEYQGLRAYIINKVEHFGTADEISNNIQKINYLHIHIKVE
jgi:pyruvate-formate lyase